MGWKRKWIVMSVLQTVPSKSETVSIITGDSVQRPDNFSGTLTSDLYTA